MEFARVQPYTVDTHPEGKLVNLFRLTAYFGFVQCCLSGAAFAGALAPVPEPATMGLLAVAVGGLAVARKFRSRK
jgi:hypothetical protein